MPLIVKRMRNRSYESYMCCYNHDVGGLYNCDTGVFDMDTGALYYTDYVHTHVKSVSQLSFGDSIYTFSLRDSRILMMQCRSNAARTMVTVDLPHLIDHAYPFLLLQKIDSDDSGFTISTVVGPWIIELIFSI